MRMPRCATRRAFARGALALMCACAPLRFAAHAAGARSYRVIDLAPAFWQFWSAAQGQPVPQQARLLHDMLVAHHPEVYNAQVLGFDATQPLQHDLERRYTRWLARLRPHLERMRRVSQQIAGDLPRYERSFRAAFPDMAYDGEVYFLNSLGAFDGATRTVKGRTALLFGVDMIALIYGDGVDPQAFFHHELFHVYHAQVAPAVRGEHIYRDLWGEGLAIHVAQTLNPAAAGVALFGLPLDMPARARRMLPELARDLRAHLDSTAREIYLRYFLGHDMHGDVPPRSGYYVGYEVARRIGRGQSLQALARLQGPALRAAIEQALRDIEAGR
ncbi:MAG: hypothetical protein KIT60_21165 [Burkholderiaceae bacterium]|nr:hypothetical protein [Burkholderiaceae bacterium]